MNNTRRLLAWICTLGTCAVSVTAQTANPDVVWAAGGCDERGFAAAISGIAPGTIITGSHSGMIHIWDARQLSVPRSWHAHARDVTGLALLNDSTLVSSSEDGYIRSWAMHDGSMIGEISSGKPLGAIRVLPDSSRVVALAWDAIVIADVIVDTVIKRIWRLSASNVSELEVAGDVVITLENIVTAWDIDADTVRYVVESTSGYDQIAVTPDGSTLFASDRIDTLTAFEARTGAFLRGRRPDTNLFEGCTDMSMSPDGRWLLQLGSSKTLIFNDLIADTNAAMQMSYGGIDDGHACGAVDGDRIWASGTEQVSYGSTAPVLNVMDIRTRRDRSLVGFAAGVERIVFTDSGTTLVATDGRKVRLLMSSNAEILRELFDPFCSYTISVDGKMASTGCGDSEVGLGGEVTYRSLFHEAYSYALIAEHLTSPGPGTPAPLGLYHLWRGDIWNKATRQTRPISAGRSDSYEFSYDASMIVGLRNDDGVDIFRSDSALLLRNIRTGARSRTAIFSRNGRMIATADADQRIRIADVETGEIIQTIDIAEPDTVRVSSIVFSQNAEWLISGSTAGALSVWNVASGELNYRYRHTTPITSVDVAPGGKYIVTGCADGSVVLWMARGGIASVEVPQPTSRPVVSTLSSIHATLIRADDELIISLDGMNDLQKATVALHDVLGRTLFDSHYEVLEHDSRLVIPLIGMTPGTYLITVTSPRVCATAVYRLMK